MHVHLRYLDASGQSQQKLLAGLQLDSSGRIYVPAADSSWQQLPDTRLFHGDAVGAALVLPLIEPEQAGDELVCLIDGDEVARSRQGFHILRGREGDVDRLVNLESDTQPVYADWLAGDWRSVNAQGTRGERLLFLDARLFARQAYLAPGTRSRLSGLSDLD